MSAFFVVRAQVVDPSVKEAFDKWYQDEHLPDAMKAFGATGAWRAWSDADPSVHYAYYEFEDLAKARAVPGSEAIKPLIAEFDRLRGKKVLRTREVVRVVQRVGA
jgi:hypothetical protein